MFRWHTEAFLYSPQLEDSGGGAAVDENPAEVAPIPGGGFTGVRLRNGKWAIRNVPFMHELEAGERGNEEPIGREWMEAALEASKAREKNDKYLAPIHVDHHGFLNSDASGAGLLRPVRVLRMPYEGKLKWTMVGDFLNLKTLAYQKCKDVELPYRSIEVFDWTKPEIASLALMEHHVPFFRMALLTIAREVDASETIEGIRLSALDYKPAGEKMAEVMDRARRGFICLSALGKPKGYAFLQKFEEKKVTDEKDAEAPDDAEKYGEELEEKEGTEACAAEIHETLETVRRIEGYMTGALTPEESKKPVEQEEPDDDGEENKETRKMSAELKAQLDAMKKAQDESNKAIAMLAAGQRKAELRLEVERVLGAVKGAAKLKAKCEEYLGGADLAVAEVQVRALLDAAKLGGEEKPAEEPKPELKKKAAAPDTSDDPDPSFESFGANPKGEPDADMPKEVLAYEKDGAKKFQSAKDAYASWKRGKKLGFVKDNLANFLKVNVNGLGPTIKASVMATMAASEEDNEPEEKEEE